MSGIGALRHRLAHHTPVDLSDGAGGITRTFVVVDLLWGAIESVSADFGLAEDRPRASGLFRITVRAPNTVSTGDRLVHAGRIFHVEQVSDPDGRGRLSRIRCREEQA